MRIYEKNRTETVETILESDTVAVAVRELAEQGSWEGTAADLLKALNAVVSEEGRKAKTWPKTPRGLSGDLRRSAPGLRKLGFIVEMGQRENTWGRRRLISISKGPQQPSEQSEPSKDFIHNTMRPDGRPAAAEEPSVEPSVLKERNNTSVDRMDGLDGRMDNVTEAEETWTV